MTCVKSEVIHAKRTKGIHIDSSPHAMMSLYDDLEPTKQKPEQVSGWSSGIKLFQSQMQLKKAGVPLPKREQGRKAAATMAPVMNLKSKKDEDDFISFPPYTNPKKTMQQSYTGHVSKDYDWNIANEYDPVWPNDYEKVAKDLKEIREREREKEEMEELDRRKRAREERNGRRDRDVKSGMGGRKESDEEEDEGDKPQRTGGAAIAPPPSLQECSPLPPPPPVGNAQPANITFAGSAVAAKIMAKYGFKDGQGLGKKEQGMAAALQVEKTSKRGGRIIHEKDIIMPPAASLTPPVRSESPKPEPTITEILKSPTKVVLLRNMVGPGEVDPELEPEVKDECNTKYGDVNKVIIFEMPGAPHDEAIRIFVEFKRIESAIKAVVDLNGRFFGGRQVKAGFYDWSKFNSLSLAE